MFLICEHHPVVSDVCFAIRFSVVSPVLIVAIMGSIGIDQTMSESSTPSDSTVSQRRPYNPPQQKRSATDAGLKPNGMRPTKSVKRRASKACQCCRARKVRCNVVEHGAPCTNCRLDEVECIVSESKRKKCVDLLRSHEVGVLSNVKNRKWSNGPELTPQLSKSQPFKPASTFPMSAAPPYEPLKRTGEHVPHALCQ